jgi:transitional endoplasmic reticulum ATPase
MSFNDQLKSHELAYGEQYSVCEASISDIQKILSRCASRLTAEILVEAGRNARGDAFSLKLIFAKTPVRLLVYAVMLLWPFVSFSASMGSILYIFINPFLFIKFYWFVFLVYGVLVYWGYRRKVRQLVGASPEILRQFGEKSFCLLYINNQTDGKSSSLFNVVRAPWPGSDFVAEMTVRGFTGKVADTACLAVFNSEDSSQIDMLLRIPEGDRAPEVVSPSNKKDPLMWPTRERLLLKVAPELTPFIQPVRALGFHVFEWKRIRAEMTAAARQEAHRKAEQERQQRAMAVKMAKWQKLALKPKLSDDLLKLTRHFISGAKPAPTGVLFYGPPGTGKTTIAKHMAEFAECHFEVVTLADLKGKYQGHTAPMVIDVWKRCREKSPTLLIVDECEGIFARRGSTETDSFSGELIQTFLQQWDGMNSSNGHVLVIGITNRRDMLDDAVLQRFTMAYEIGLPDDEARMRILANELAMAGVKMTLPDLLVKETSGMSGRDLVSTVRLLMTQIEARSPQVEDIVAAIRQIRGKGSMQVADMTWDDIVIPASLRESLENLGHNLKDAEKLQSMGIEPPGGALLYGPPGTGKTQIARVLASQSGLGFLAAGTADLKANFLGQSGGRVQALFQKARTMAPCILFLDEIDIIAPVRDGRSDDNLTVEIVGQLLQELDGISSRKGEIFLLCASNLIHRIDPAILQRLEEKIEIKLPDHASRVAILKLELKNKPVSADVQATIDSLAQRTEGWSGRQLSKLVLRASGRALNRVRREGLSVDSLSISQADFEASMQEREAA